MPRGLILQRVSVDQAGDEMRRDLLTGYIAVTGNNSRRSLVTAEAAGGSACPYGWFSLFLTKSLIGRGNVRCQSTLDPSLARKKQIFSMNFPVRIMSRTWRLFGVIVIVRSNIEGPRIRPDLWTNEPAVHHRGALNLEISNFDIIE
jgi:hypothetical protein